MQLFPSGGGRNDSASSEGHCSLYLFATRAPVKAKYALALLKAPPPPVAPLLVVVADADIPPTVVPTPPPQLSTTGSQADVSSVTTVPPPPTLDGDRLADEAGVLYVCHGSTKSFGSPSEGIYIFFFLNLFLSFLF